MPHDGCRKIANTFNRLYAERRKVTVGKTYVSNVIQQHRYEIRQTRHAIRNRKLKAQPKNRIWGIDLTQVRDIHQQAHTLFGAIDHGTRACVCLRQIPSKASITLLRVLCDAVEHYGKPRAIRTDNEAVFTSRLFRFGLWLLGIKHQRTEKHCPWMNGRIERFFGTLKTAIGKIALTESELTQRLAEFRFYYNHIRPHQHLDGSTPAEVWSSRKPNSCGKSVYCQYWNGALAGFYLPPG